MPTKTKIVSIAVPVTILLVVLGLFFFLGRGEKTVVVENQGSMISEQGAAIGEQLSQISEQDGKEDSSDQESTVDEQDEEISEQDAEAKDEKGEEIEEQEKESQSLASDEAGDEKGNDELNIKDRLVSWGHQKSSGRKIDTIIVHSSYNALGGGEYDRDLLIKEYKEYEVSPHYLIDRKGKVYRLVEDKDIAWHAGVSEVPDGREGVNNFSIGIELINNKEDEYTKAQYESLNNLIDYLKGKYKIKYILGHSEVSPGRKTDPWNMDWQKVDR